MHQSAVIGKRTFVYVIFIHDAVANNAESDRALLPKCTSQVKPIPSLFRLLLTP